MTALAINLLALLIVLGLCWAAMMWLSGRFHGQRRTSEFQAEHWDEVTATTTEQRNRHGHANPAPRAATGSLGAPEVPCAVCDGVGAQTSQGRLAPCPECYGTGVLS